LLTLERKPATDLHRFGRPMIVAVGAVVAVFLVYALVERLWLSQLETRTLHLLHVIRGVLASLLASALAIWTVLRTSPPLLVTSKGLGEVGAGSSSEDDRLLHYAVWFIHMRWVAIVCAAALVVIAVAVARLLPSEVWPPLVGILVALAAANLSYGAAAKKRRGRRALLLAQAYGDLVALVLLLHFSGGIENPLSMLMVLHVIIAGVVLNRGSTYAVAACGGALFAALALLEWGKVLHHYTLLIFPHGEGNEVHAAHQTLFVMSRIALRFGILFLVAYFVTKLAEWARRSEQMLLQAERLVATGRTAGQVAHEVNNPISIISGKARLLLDASKGPLVRHRGFVEMAPPPAAPFHLAPETERNTAGTSWSSRWSTCR